MIEGFLKDNPIKDPNDIQELMKEMMRQVLQSGLAGELDDELGYTRYDYRNKETDNSRNGFSKKTMHTSMGDMDIDVPRDRKGEFEPQLVPKHQNTLTQDMEGKIISMYAKEWQSRPLESIYAVVFMDAIHFHVRSEGQIVKKAVYIAIGIDLDGSKDVLGMWVGENESAKFWLSVMNGLRNRGYSNFLC